ncbi:hypothetical protein Acr_05g0012620 [Actinidia rufa]|uniref:Uncharacterized protein n=1 Tax=Actinidia rufa TaxID=165716 RepID=A0A7J0EMB9_9ERIC|nr:hypothetical protein Acr_05g0012620 [Actinidia rufa]
MSDRSSPQYLSVGVRMDRSSSKALKEINKKRLKILRGKKKEENNMLVFEDLGADLLDELLSSS